MSHELLSKVFSESCTQVLERVIERVKDQVYGQVLEEVSELVHNRTFENLQDVSKASSQAYVRIITLAREQTEERR